LDDLSYDYTLLAYDDGDNDNSERVEDRSKLVELVFAAQSKERNGDHDEQFEASPTLRTLALIDKHHRLSQPDIVISILHLPYHTIPDAIHLDIDANMNGCCVVIQQRK
jgi:hypothetical protein